MAGARILVIGNVNVDIVMGPQTPWPVPGTEVILPDYELRVGGSAGNSALALRALGVPFQLIANAGSDVLGQWLRDSFGEAAADWRLADAPTTVSVGISHPDGERTFFTNVGHLEVFGPDDVLPRIGPAPDGAVALVVGVFLSPKLQNGLAGLLSKLRTAGWKTALDTGWPSEGWTEEVRASSAAWLRHTDVLLVNEAEAHALSGFQDLEAAGDRIRQLLPPGAVLVVKRGANGAQAWQGDS